MQERALLGDEAIALGAIHAGISAAYAYPGTPSTEITEYILRYAEAEGKPKASWCANEKTAYEEALGVSILGKRALVAMKHVGLNVAADPFMNSALLDIRGGLVLVVADDPGMHSSQNEQDSRYFADLARIVCLEPRNQQEAYDMTRLAFDLSESLHIPVMIRIVTRLAHARAGVKLEPVRAENPLKKTDDTSSWMLLPALARRQWGRLLEKQKDFFALTEGERFNPLRPGADKAGGSGIAVITSGLGGNYYDENRGDLPKDIPHLHINAYPIPPEKVRTLAAGVKQLFIIEEGYPFIEGYLRGLLEQPVIIRGKKDGTLPPTGELTPDVVREGLSKLFPNLPKREGLSVEGLQLPARPPQLCKGCPHGDSYSAIKKALEGYTRSLVTSDIGCYALGALPPYSAIETIVCMGASISMAVGASETGFHPVVATIGDSTFLHSGITPLIDAVARKASVTVVILDNSTVAMTGGQDTVLPVTRLPEIVAGIGVPGEHIRIVGPLPKDHEENARIIREEIEYRGVSVIISSRECIEQIKKRTKPAGGGKA